MLKTNLIDLCVWLHNSAQFFFWSYVLCVAKIQLQLNSIAFYIMWLLHNSFHITSERSATKERNSGQSRNTHKILEFRVSAIGQTNPIPLDRGQSKLQPPPEKSTNVLRLIMPTECHATKLCRLVLFCSTYVSSRRAIVARNCDGWQGTTQTRTITSSPHSFIW